jgi:SAM-dependent methyltransferase
MNILDKFHHWRRKRRWNKQYRKGRWESLQSEKEAKRYYQILDYLKEYAPKEPVILDIGCGDGVLNERMNDYSYGYFLGLDFSKESIKKATDKEFPKAQFITADIISYTPDRNFDVIIFNEAFYYIHDSEKQKVLDRMIKHLNPNGLIITSIYREGSGCWEYFKESDLLTELDFTTVTTDEELRYWKIGAYRKN